MSANLEHEQARDIVTRAMALSPEVREGVALELLDSIDHPPDDPEEVKKAWQAELARRLESIRNGTTPLYSVAETMAYLRQTVAEANPS